VIFLKDLIRCRKNSYFDEMPRLLFMLFIAFSTYVYGVEEKKNLLVLCSNGGYGHNAAAQTLKNLLGDEYNITVVYPIDQMRIWGVKSGETIYNMLLQNDWIQSLNFVTRHVAPKIFRNRKQQIESIIARHIEETKPNLVISLIPFVNYPASEAARKKGTPYLLITTDNDLRLWVHGLQAVKHPHFKVTVGSDLWCSRELLRKRNIPDSAIETIGLPIRTDFFMGKDSASIRKEFGVPKTKPVVLIIIGGAGGEKALEYTERIGSTQFGIHLIVCAGRNKDLAEDLRKISLHPSNTMTVMGFTTKISDLMAISDLLITKSGPGTINEAMVMKLPILVDSTSTVLSWEQANIDLIMQYGIGDFVENFEELEPLLRQFLFDTEVQKEVKDSYRKLPPNRFKESIGPIVSSMCKLK
jgi:UDP-N-acetylglucosamine:LPS N-acetylglucosamine transferase